MLFSSYYSVCMWYLPFMDLMWRQEITTAITDIRTATAHITETLIRTDPGTDKHRQALM